MVHRRHSCQTWKQALEINDSEKKKTVCRALVPAACPGPDRQSPRWTKFARAFRRRAGCGLCRKLIYSDRDLQLIRQPSQIYERQAPVWKEPAPRARPQQKRPPTPKPPSLCLPEKIGFLSSIGANEVESGREQRARPHSNTHEIQVSTKKREKQDGQMLRGVRRVQPLPGEVAHARRSYG